MLIVCGHQKETHYDKGNVQEHKPPNEWYLPIWLNIVVECFLSATIVHVELTQLEWLRAHCLFIENKRSVWKILVPNVSGQNEEVLHGQVPDSVKLLPTE